MKKKVGLLILLLSLFIGVVVQQQLRAVSELKGNDISISKTVTKNSKGEYDLTFSLPSTQGEIVKEADVVIVIDKSSVSDLAGLKAATAKLIDTMNAKKGVSFKVGVVWYNANVHDGTNGLLNLNNSTEETIKDAIVNYSGSGTNLYGGILRGMQWLEADTSVPDNYKFLIVASDFGGYLTDAGNGEGLVRFSSDDGIKAAYRGNFDITSKYGYNYVSDKAKISDLINNKILLNGVLSDDDYLTKIGGEVGEYSFDGNVGALSAAQIAGLRKAADFVLPDMPSMFEKSIYLSGNLLNEANDKGYRLIGVTKAYSSANSTARYASDAFKEWFEDIGDRYDLDSGMTAEKAFDDIASEIFDLIGSGVITDELSDDFDIVEGSYTILDDGIEIPSVKIDDSHIGFGDPDDNGVYPYVLEYAANHTIKWHINATASRYELLQLTMGVKYNKDVCLLKNDNELYTSKMAQINYMSSVEKLDGVLDFTKALKINNPAVLLSSKGSNCTDTKEIDIDDNNDSSKEQDEKENKVITPPTGNDTLVTFSTLLILSIIFISSNYLFNNRNY
ncbi:MAG: VWA domain-containing protein [Bacilli bacterium]|jgi:hypothetical protein|nr:VWA domain-containing protein [Bacilli bacterium]